MIGGRRRGVGTALSAVLYSAEAAERAEHCRGCAFRKERRGAIALQRAQRVPTQVMLTKDADVWDSLHDAISSLSRSDYMPC